MLSLSFCWAQSNTFKGEWKTKQYHKDTLVFISGGYSYNDSSLDRKEDYTDTTYYWNFLANDSLSIEYAIRSNKIVATDSSTSGKLVLVGNPEYYTTEKIPASKKERKEVERILSGHSKSKRNKKETHKGELTTAENNNDNTMQIRTSLWSAERGRWTIRQDHITVIQTKSFNGTYRLVFINSNRMLLIKVE